VVEISDSHIPAFNCAFHLSANPPQAPASGRRRMSPGR